MHNIKRSGEKCAQGAGRSGLSAAVGGYIVDECACVQQVCSKALRLTVQAMPFSAWRLQQ